MSTRPKRPQPSALNFASFDSKLSIVTTSSLERAIMNGAKCKVVGKRMVHDGILFIFASCLGTGHSPNPALEGSEWGVGEEYQNDDLPRAEQNKKRLKKKELESNVYLILSLL